MPAQKRPASPPAAAPAANGHPLPLPPNEQPQVEAEQPPPPEAAPNPPPVKYDSDGDGSNPSSPSADDQDDEYVLVKLADVRKDVQCPICLGIIRKTRTVMECLHRFCKECIDRSMRLGNNECPSCRTHCASRRSLRPDPKFDLLISTLYPDIDEYEEEESAFHEEEKTRNRKIQESIAEISRRQTEALGRKRSAKATAAAFVRKSQRNFRSNFHRGGGRGGARENVLIGSDEEDGEEEQDVNGNAGGRDSSDEERSPEARQKRRKRSLGPGIPPAGAADNSALDGEENEDTEISRENLGMTAPLLSSSIETLAWGKGGTRSNNRHGSASGLRFKGGRLSKLAEHLRSSDENDDEIEVHLTLQPLDEKRVPYVERPHISCRPSVSIGHICQFIAINVSTPAEKIEILVNAQGETLPIAPDPSQKLQILGVQESVGELCASFTPGLSDLVLLYRLKM